MGEMQLKYQHTIDVKVETKEVKRKTFTIPELIIEHLQDGQRRTWKPDEESTTSFELIKDGSTLKVTVLHSFDVKLPEM